MTRMRIMLVLFALLALTVGVATATAAGGNSANAKLCQKNGWQKLLTSTGASFATEEACTSYAAAGGTLTPKTKSQLDCESYGGAFATGTGKTLWTCGLGYDESAFVALEIDCRATNDFNGFSWANNSYECDVQQSQFDCQSYGGAFAPGTGSTLWTCGLGYDETQYNALLLDCYGSDSGNSFSWANNTYECDRLVLS